MVDRISGIRSMNQNKASVGFIRLGQIIGAVFIGFPWWAASNG
jgi:hypothetical protein